MSNKRRKKWEASWEEKKETESGRVCEEMGCMKNNDERERHKQTDCEQRDMPTEIEANRET